VRIGVIPVLDRSWGGMYQYSVTLLHALCDLQLDDDLLLFAPSQDSVPNDLRDAPFEVVVLPDFDYLGSVRRVASRVLPPSTIRRIRHAATSVRGVDGTVDRLGAVSDRGSWRTWFEPFELDLLVFTVESEIAFRSGVPYMVSIHDLQHRLQPDLPEFADESDWERREFRMRNTIARATLVLVDSETGKEDVLDCYGDTGIDPDAVMPLPSAPAHYLSSVPSERERADTRARYMLPNTYLFYPAQFWPHKNHRRIVEALGILVRDRLEPHLVLAGSKSGRLRQRTFDEMMDVARALGVSERIHYLGYVPDEYMAALYAEATALVMPTFFGPTNIPVIEAWHFDVPVITSDLRGIREQVEDAAVLVDPESSMSIAGGIRRVLEDATLRTELVANGHKQLAAYTHEDYLARVAEVLSEAKRRIATSRVFDGGDVS
jgi:glycosyltransferase involved in cell wall biosynthesis